MIDRPLRFCMLTTFYPPYSFGGDATYVQQVSLQLAERGHHVEIIHCIDSYNLVAQNEKPRAVIKHPNIIVHQLKSKWGFLSPLATQQTGYPFFKRQAISKILAQGFDVIHYHNTSLVGGPGLLEFGDAVKLYTAHEYWLVCPMSVLFRYDGVACNEKRCLRCTLANGRPPQWWRYTSQLDHALKHLDCLIFPTSFSQDKHRAMGIDVNSAVLPYFHSPSPSAEPDCPRDRSNPFFLYVGRLELLKGVHTLIPVFKQRSDIRLVIVGDGRQLPALRGLAADAPNIEFKGWQDHATLKTLYRDAAALVVPSLCFEGGPLVVLEAAAHGTPTVGRAIGAIPEMIGRLRGGLTYTDDTSLNEALDVMLNDRARRDTMGANAFAEFHRGYTADAHLEGYFRIIEQAMQTRKQPSAL